MGFVEILLLGVGLSMDAFAVAICKGLGMKQVNYRHTLVIALFFGGFQALMPLIGWALGSQFAALVTPVDHWIAFLLLAFIGGKMLWDAFHEQDDQPQQALGRLEIKELFMLAIATSIDALAVGITFAFLECRGITLLRVRWCGNGRHLFWFKAVLASSGHLPNSTLFGYNVGICRKESPWQQWRRPARGPRSRPEQPTR